MLLNSICPDDIPASPFPGPPTTVIQVPGVVEGLASQIVSGFVVTRKNPLKGLALIL